VVLTSRVREEVHWGVQRNYGGTGKKRRVLCDMADITTRELSFPYFPSLRLLYDRSSSVGIATGYRLD
jgi:hypothetical protein